MLNSLLRIARFNGVDKDPLFQNKIDTFMRYIKFGDSSKYEQAINCPPGDNVINVAKDNSMVDVYTSESVRVSTRLNTEFPVETSRKSDRTHVEFITVDVII